MEAGGRKGCWGEFVTSVVDPYPNSVGSETFSRISDPDADQKKIIPDLDPGSPGSEMNFQ